VEGSSVNPERDPTSIVRSWLENGVTDLPDRVLDPVLDQLPSTPQRRRRWQARRSNRMNATLKVVTVAAAVVVVGVVGVSLLPGSSKQGTGAATTPAPSATLTPSPSASQGAITDSQPLGPGPLAAGRYHVDLGLHDYVADGGPALMASGVARVTFDVPDGWIGFEDWAITKPGAGAPGELAMAPLTIESIFLDPCHWAGTAAHAGADDWDRGRTMNGLADGLWTSWATDPGAGYSARSGTAATSPKATRPAIATLAGRDARYVEVRAPADLDLATCDGGQYTLWVDLLGGQRYIHRAGELNRLWIVDVKGSTVEAPGGLLVLDAASHPGSSPQDLAELQAIVDSVHVELLTGP
jgi:hypothetical protein